MLSDMEESQFVKVRCGHQSGTQESTEEPLKCYLKQSVSFSGNVK